jgi:formate dehydrogenase major subunit
MRLTVDGTDVQVPAGSSILDAIHAAGGDIPTLCHDERLAPSGACRVCLVHVRKGDGDTGDVAAACVTPAVDGARVETTHAETIGLVRQVAELMVARLPASALNQPTQLAEVCRWLGVAAGGAEGRGLGRDDTHPYVRLDRDLCIACGRCVRMCDEVQGTFALTLAGHGADTMVAPGPGTWAESACVACGGCIDTCPSGALTGPHPWAVPRQTVTTTCGYCGVGCSLEVHSGPDGISVTPDHSGPVNRGHACVKGRFAHGFVTSTDRLTTPLIRQDGHLHPASWNEALELVATRLRRITAEHGPDAVAAISSARATNEENYLMQKLMRTVIGTNNIDNCSRICHAPSAAGLTAAFGLAGGTNPADDIERADCFLLAGANPTEAHPVIGARIKQRVLAGARLIVVDPRRTELARLADVHLRGRPGSNVAIFNGMARLMFEHGWVDDEFLSTRADGLDELRAQLSEYPPHRVAEISGVDPGDLTDAARLFGTAAFPSIMYGLGITEHAHGTDGVRCLANLAILKGAVGTPRGGGVNPLRGQNNVQGASDMGALPDLLPGYQRVTDAAVRGRCEQVWGRPVPPTPGLRIPDMFDAALAGRLKALYVIGENIVQTDPDAAAVRAAVQACEFVISQEIFLSETAALAHVVLPAASFLEKDGTFVNFDRRFQRVRPALSPPGQARTDFEIIQAVGAALGADLGCRNPAEAMAECARVSPLFAGISHERLDLVGALHWPCRSPDDPGEARLHQERFATPTGRAQLAARPWLPPGEAPDADYPCVLVTGRRLVHYNAGTMTRRTDNLALLPAETLDIHPSDAARIGVDNGDAVRVTSRRGGITAAARLTEDVAPGEVFMAFHFPDTPANLLTSSHHDDVTSCPEYKVTAVRLKAAATEP